MSVGWKLAEEIAWARPERPGPEWWTLMDIAQDARDETRQSMCGHEYLMARGKCSKATLYRRLKSLTEQNLITVVRRPAPGLRAIYGISADLTTGLTIAETRTGLTNDETRTEANVSHSGLNGSQNSPQRVSAFVNPTPSGTPSQYAVTSETSVVVPEVEVPRLPIEEQVWRSLHPAEP